MLRSKATAYWLTAAVLTIAFCYGFADYPLLEPDEGRNAEVAREMAITNDYILPRLNGLPYLDKPILFFAAGALSMELFGPTEFAARLPSLIFTVGTLLLVGWFGRRHFDTESALTVVIATAATPFALAYSRTVIFDSALTFFVVAAILSLFEAIEASVDERAAWWRVAAWSAMALGVLTKGPIALAVPILACAPYAIWRKRVRRTVDLLSVLLCLALVLPWAFAVSQEIPGFVRYVVLTETVSRLSSDALGRGEPWWYFLAILPAAALPWSLLLLGNWRRLRAQLHTENGHYRWFFISWLLVPLIFFSLSVSKRPQYMLPLLPAIAFLCALAWRDRETFGDARAAGIGLGVIGGFLIVVHDNIADWVTASISVAPVIPQTAMVLGGVCIIAGSVVVAGFRHRAAVLFGLTLPVAAIPVIGADLMKSIGTDRSARDLARAISAASTEAQVIAIETLPLSLPFYLRRSVLVATNDGIEFTSNYLLRHFDAWKNRATVRPVPWWRDALLECSRPRVFIAAADDEATRSELAQALPTLAVTRKHAAYGPCGLPQLAGLR